MVSRQKLGIRDWGSGIRDGLGIGPESSPSVSLRALRGEKRRRAFTLVELLVVITIIGVLAGLIVAVAPGVIRAAHRMTITTEIGQLTMAMERYKQEHGEYPPDFCGVNDANAIVRTAARQTVLNHLRRAFPRYRIPAGTIDNRWDYFRLQVKQCTSGDPSLTNAGDAIGMEVNAMTPDMALVFWLGGMPAPAGSSTRLVTFSANPANPFAVGGSRKEAFFEFDEARLARNAIAGNNNHFTGYRYRPPHVQDPDGGEDAPPYVYFRAKSDRYDPLPPTDIFVQFFTWQGTFCVPYGRDSVPPASAGDPNEITQWFNPKTCQIICSGLDGMYAEFDSATSTPGALPSRPIRYLQTNGQAGSGNLTSEEEDNLTNFARGTLADWHEGE
ncbi:MAG: type II secretion system protein [Pirellulales bacterium]|nr:type II secretion system protein [Pirellulales bacterium]